MTSNNPKPNHYYIIYQQWKKKTEKVSIPENTKVEASEINKIVDARYECLPSCYPGWVIAHNFDGHIDEINKKATKKLSPTEQGTYIPNDAVLIHMEDLKWVAGDKRQLMEDYMQEEEAQTYFDKWWQGKFKL